MNEFEETQKLIKLKRYEQPPAGYLEGFLGEFHQRQRAELMRRSSRSLFFERLATYFSGFGERRWLLATGAACAAMLVFVGFGTNATHPQAAAVVPQDFDAPQGQVTPVSTSSLLDPEFDLLEDFVAPIEVEAGRVPRFFVEPFAPHPAGEAQIIEL